jgi:hypothetical protein
MISTDYLVYVQNAINIVRSLVIKQDMAAITLNRSLKELGDTIPESPYNWKYYLNLAGIKYDNGNVYTANDNIYIRSLDTNVNILLTPETLAQHPITLNELQLKGLLYKKLLNKYPDEEFYIDGILNPIDLTTSVDSKDFTILYYNKYLIEKNEVNLMPQMQEWVYNFCNRWFNPGYCLTDKHYPYVFIGDVFLHLVKLIIDLRLKNCKTNMAHSYHVWNYLGGFYELDQYRDVIMQPQAMFLYLNIEYLVKNNSTQKNLDLFNDGLITPSKLKLKKYNLIHNVKTTYNQVVEDHNVIAGSDVFAIKIDLDRENNIVNVNEIETLEKTIEVLNPLGLLNSNEATKQKEIIDENSLKTIYTNLPTGILEVSNIPDPTSSLVDALYEKVTQWIYMANEDYIKYDYTINNVSGITQPITITPKQAVVILLAIDKLLTGETLTSILHLTLTDVLDEYVMTDEQILKLIERKYYYQRINLPNGESLIWDKFEYIKNSLVLPEYIFNVEDYVDYGTRLVNMRIQHILLIGTESENFGKSQLKSVLNCFNRTVELDLTPYITFNQFFNHLGLDLRDLSNKTLRDLMITILIEYLGIGKDVIETENLVKGVMNILKTLTSYSLQYTYLINDNRINKIDWPMLGITDISNTLDPDFADFSIESKIGINTLEPFDYFADTLNVTISYSGNVSLGRDEGIVGTISGNSNIVCQLESIVDGNIINTRSLSGE